MTAFRRTRIGSSTPLGKKLQRARKRKELSLRAVELATKVPLRHLEAIESGQYHLLPEQVYLRGFLTRYATCLGLAPEKVLAEYEHEYTAWNDVRHVRLSKQNQEEGLLRPHVTDEWLVRARQWHVTPEVLWGATASLFLVGILGYIWFQVASFAAAPPLDVVSPGTDVAVTVQQIEVAGITDPGATLTINNQAVAVDAEGHFRQKVQLAPGINTIELAATNKADKETVKTIQLLADVPTEDIELPNDAAPEGQVHESDQ